MDIVSIGLGHLFGPLSNMDHPLLPKTEMVQLVMPIWTMDGPFDSYTSQLLGVSTGRADHGLAQSNSFWAGYGRAQLINGPTGQKTNWYMV